MPTTERILTCHALLDDGLENSSGGFIFIPIFGGLAGSPKIGCLELVQTRQTVSLASSFGN